LKTSTWAYAGCRRLSLIYSFTDIALGEYSIRTIKEGFSIQEKNGYRGAGESNSNVGFTRKIGAVKQTITVQQNLLIVDSTTAELGTAITTKLVNDLPLNGRNFTQLLVSTPGISPVSVAQNSKEGGVGEDLQ